MHVNRLITTALLATLLAEVVSAQGTPGFELQEPMSPELRAEFGFVVVRPGGAVASEHLTGTYNKDSLTMAEGVAKGGGLGRVGTDIGGIPVSMPVPILGELGMIVGGLIGAQQEAMQDFRDRLARDLVDAGGKPMSSESLADDVFWLIRGVPSLKTRLLLAEQPIPSNTEAVLFVSVDSIQISVKESDAVIMTTATATLMRSSDSRHVFEQQFVYEDRDTLENWTRDDDAAWHSYAAYARHYLAREIAARLYERVGPWSSLTPAKSRDIKPIKKNLWAGTTKVAMPELVWNAEVLDPTVPATAVTYDIEIYDPLQMVYAERGLQATSYRVPIELDGCQTYRWSVRPVLHYGNEVRYGEWMRADDGKATQRGGIGQRASEATAYLYDFPSFSVKCGRR
ncbi:MAG: hypothetical protein AAFN50_06575 [Pseudomonadota bacterium]